MKKIENYCGKILKGYYSKVSNHLAKMPELAKWLNSDLSKGFTIPQVAQKYDWPEPMVWAQALKGKDDQARFKELNWGIRTWDLWNFTCDL